MEKESFSIGNKRYDVTSLKKDLSMRLTELSKVMNTNDIRSQIHKLRQTESEDNLKKLTNNIKTVMQKKEPPIREFIRYLILQPIQQELGKIDFQDLSKIKEIMTMLKKKPVKERETLERSRIMEKGLTKGAPGSQIKFSDVLRQIAGRLG